ncbi:MAG: diguanylate cyclase [Solirubrobacteraceae bacterium]|nr:diguanylate cyclase [Solirubrobacteraceae bacterium]
MRRLSLPALVIAVVLLPASFALAGLGRDSARRGLDKSLRHEAAQQQAALDGYFERARAVALLTAHNPSFREFYGGAGARRERIVAGGRQIADARAGLLYVERLYPQSIGEVCFIDRSGSENARAVRGRLAATSDLSHDESANPFFHPTFALRQGQVYQSAPYVSPDTGEWVIGNSTLVPAAGRAPAIVHFEATIESFRRAAAHAGRFPIKVVDRRTGSVIVDSRTVQRRGARLGVPSDRRFRALRMRSTAAGALSLAGRRVAYTRVPAAAGNANDWLVVAIATTPAPSLTGSFGAGPIGMVIAAVLLLAFALVAARAGHLSSEANRDELTGLTNRRGLLRRLDRAIRRASRNGQAVALLMIDLDHFKELNDTLGHAVGDSLLAKFGPRLADAIPDADTLARLGGDEFAVVLADADAQSAAGVAQRISSALDAPFALDEVSLHVDASIGIALFPDDGADAADLLQRADVAMYQAKRGRTGWAAYDAERDVHSRARLALVEDLRRALQRDELVLVYQPKAALRSGEVKGVEALVRWQHPTRGLLAPGEFVAVAEQAGLMRQLTARVLDVAVAQAARWRSAGLPLTVAVNVSATDLVDSRFPGEVEQRLADYDLPAGALQLEVTEDTVMSDPDRALEVLARLSEIGVGLSLDDYGTGYSSLAYIKRLPVRELKIDRSFVFNMDTDEQDATIVRSTVELAHNLGLRVVAEGVETQASWDALADMGAHYAQGYLLTRPLPAAELEAWLCDWRRTPIAASARTAAPGAGEDSAPLAARSA